MNINFFIWFSLEMNKKKITQTWKKEPPTKEQNYVLIPSCKTEYRPAQATRRRNRSSPIKKGKSQNRQYRNRRGPIKKGKAQNTGDWQPGQVWNLTGNFPTKCWFVSQIHLNFFVDLSVKYSQKYEKVHLPVQRTYLHLSLWKEHK